LEPWDQVVANVALRAWSAQPADLLFETPPRIGAPLDLSSLGAIRDILGFDPPGLLVDLFTRIGNGGFGPGYGLMSLTPAPRRAFGGDAVAVHRFFQAAHAGDEIDPMDEALAWPVGLLPIVHWGCTLYSCIDCSAPDLPVLHFDCDGLDTDADKPVMQVARPSGFGFAEWLNRWALGHATAMG
jgi:hypothetical protein